jgi:hypothetical protein
MRDPIDVWLDLEEKQRYRKIPKDSYWICSGYELVQVKNIDGDRVNFYSITNEHDACFGYEYFSKYSERLSEEDVSLALLAKVP